MQSQKELEMRRDVVDVVVEGCEEEEKKSCMKSIYSAFLNFPPVIRIFDHSKHSLERNQNHNARSNPDQ